MRVDMQPLISSPLLCLTTLSLSVFFESIYPSVSVGQ